MILENIKYIADNLTISIANSPSTKVKYPNPAKTSLVARL